MHRGKASFSQHTLRFGMRSVHVQLRENLRSTTRELEQMRSQEVERPRHETEELERASRARHEHLEKLVSELKTELNQRREECRRIEAEMATATRQAAGLERSLSDSKKRELFAQEEISRLSSQLELKTSTQLEWERQATEQQNQLRALVNAHHDLRQENTVLQSENEQNRSRIDGLKTELRERDGHLIRDRAEMEQELVRLRDELSTAMTSIEHHRVRDQEMATKLEEVGFRRTISSQGMQP